jgi:hypothetical protein
MRSRDLACRDILLGTLAVTVLLSGGGCVPADAQQWTGFLNDLLRNALAAFLL